MLYFKHLYPNANLTAFEANPFAYALLKENIEHNNLKNIQTYCTALYDKETTLPLVISSRNVHSFAGSLKHELGDTRSLPVKTTRLSDYIKDLANIDLIKIDIEGAEIEVIRDLQETGLLKKSDRYIIEHHQMLKDPDTLAATINIFRKNNYGIRLFDEKCFGQMTVVMLDITKNQ